MNPETVITLAYPVSSILDEPKGPGGQFRHRFVTLYDGSHGVEVCFVANNFTRAETIAIIPIVEWNRIVASIQRNTHEMP